ncbi:glycoside hydrolase family 16 protein [Fusarium austroafricanum]|uniref:Glycoside hydrolase family 16 protein n=1 Tax=Fusarium austroafricanum TaxID=2364996 RepID=A0A8H4K7M0_9HYPO|nr:glycoside hydrolase family 16 protein [Fusarium austroafricanum]
MHLTSYLSVAVTVVGLVAASPKGCIAKRSPEPKLENGHYIVDRATKFANKQVWTFNGKSLPDGLYASDYPVGDTHVFKSSNVKIRNGYVELTVPGGQKQMPYKSAEIATDFENIKYASVRTTAILSEPAGVCNGMFFYKDDTQESDIEWLSDPNSESNYDGIRRLWFTNQDTSGDGNPTNKNVMPPSNPTTTEHEYRIDWTEGKTVFYVDGVKKWSTTKNVPTEAGPWIWNNWSNGDKGWSAGPPKKTAVFKIRKIEMYYNTEDDADK